MSEDPKLFDAGDHNLFRYCHNDPIDSVDPMGLDDTARRTPRDKRRSSGQGTTVMPNGQWRSGQIVRITFKEHLRSSQLGKH